MQHTAQLLWDLSIVRIVGDWTQTGTQTESPNHDLSYPFVIVNRYVFSVFFQVGNAASDFLKALKVSRLVAAPNALLCKSQVRLLRLRIRRV